LVGVAHPVFLATEECDLSRYGFVRLEQAAITLHTRYAITLRALKLHRRIAVYGAVAAVAVELFTCGAEAGARFFVVVEITGLIARRLFGLAALVVNRVGQSWHSVKVLTRLKMVG